MIEPKSYEDLADPQIDPAAWQEEMPAFFRALAQMVERHNEQLSAMVEYFQSAQTPDQVMKPVHDVHGTFGLVVQSAQQLANAAESYAASVELPHFERVS